MFRKLVRIAIFEKFILCSCEIGYDYSDVAFVFIFFYVNLKGAVYSKSFLFRSQKMPFLMNQI